MFSIHGPAVRLCDGISRREWLRVGGLTTLGLTLPALTRLPRLQAAESTDPTFGKAKSCILIMLLGGVPQHDSWDPKPNAPENVRGEFKPIATSQPGVQISEALPYTAQQAHHLGILRAMSTSDNAHSASGYSMLTGVSHIPMNFENSRPGAPNDWPSVAAVTRQMRGDRGGIPGSVVLPTSIWNTGVIPWPGQDGGFLGRAADPWLLSCDPSHPEFKVPDLSLPGDISSQRFEQRRSLLRMMESRLATLDRSAAVDRYSLNSEQAIKLLSSQQVRQAFDLTRESASRRDLYGRTRFGQSCLLARKLVEAGVSLVQVNWPRVEEQLNNGTWDTHGKNNEAMKTILAPVLDQAFAALLQDLSERGLLEETLVLCLTEFGRSPRFNVNAGRDHWGSVFSVALAGAGIRAGGVHGESDALGGQPLSGKVTPADLTATIFHSLGIPPETEIQDTAGRPLPISRGQVIRQILS